MKENKRDISYLSGDETVSAYLAMPEGKGPFPALILIHEWWGLNDWVKQNADEFAVRGYASLAIDLYRGKSTHSPDEARRFSGSVPMERALRDLRNAFNHLRNIKKIDNNCIGSIGWCMGGGYSLRAAISIPELAACVINYGRLVTDIDLLQKIHCPVLGIFGELDQNITPALVKDFESVMNETGINNRIIIYPGAGHAFMNPANKNLYNKSTTLEAWQEIYTFLQNNLMQKGN